VVRWATLDYVVDAPSNTSGAAVVTIAVADHPEIVLLDTRSISDAPAKGGTGSRAVDSLLGPLSGQSGLTLEIGTTTTPDGEMAATAKTALGYVCDSAAR
jgi:hypothetical protein